jgi:uncharacterized iron-regulated membrane protein
MRTFLTLAHRYVGLSLAGFLFLAGATGAVIALYHEIDEGLNPQLYKAPGVGPSLPPDELVARVERSEPSVRVSGLPLSNRGGESVVMRAEPRVGDASALGFDELFVDPTDGSVVGKRLWGECCFGREQLVPFLYSLHYSLHLPERAGVLVMGSVALVWVFDCFVGLALTFPRGKGFWRRWARAFRVDAKASRYRLWRDIHQASGLWLWLLLLMLAVSGVALNLHEEVFRPVVSLFSPLRPGVLQVAAEAKLEAGPRARDYGAAIDAAQRVARERSWPSEPVYAFHWKEAGAFGVGFVRPGEDPEVGMGASWVYVADGDLRFVSAEIIGEGSAGEVFAQLQFPLHSGHILGFPGRVVIALSGLVVAVLSATGVYVWAVKRAARRDGIAAPNRVRGPARPSLENQAQ